MTTPCRAPAAGNLAPNHTFWLDRQLFFMNVRMILFGLAVVSLGQRAIAVDVFVSAAADQLYSVASIEIPVQRPVVGQTFPPIRVTEPSGRVLYQIQSDVRVEVEPASEREVPQPGRGRLLRRFGALVRELIEPDQDLFQTTTRRVTFLIRGAKPIRVRLSDVDSDIGEYDIVPTVDANARETLLSQWWVAYTDSTALQIEAADYPSIVESYLVAMLSSRTHMPLPDWYMAAEQNSDDLFGTLKLIAGASDVAESIFRRAASGETHMNQSTSEKLPAPPNWSPLFAASDLDDIKVESMATRVPPECFYIRYGSFENYLWFRDLSHDSGGDISRMVMLRGVDDNATARIEKQLNLKTTELSRMLGGTIIEDQAIIGRDVFMVDGASLGVLFQAKNAFVLRSSFSSDRSKLAQQDPAVTLKKVQVAGRSVSFLSSSDNRVRSFMAEDDGFFLVTNSQTLVKRFFEVKESGESLATSSAFRLSRRLMPLEREDTIFCYFSPLMLRGLISPEYLIELRRRLFAKSDIALVHLARLAAVAEGHSMLGIDELTEAGFLPAGFGFRPDGSGVITLGERVVDTRRGARGSFLPIADVEIDSVTPEEARWYQQIAARYGTRFPTIDPIMVGVQRDKVSEATGIERITLHAEIAPWDAKKYGYLAEQLGPPTDVALKFGEDDIIAIQAHVASPQLGPPTHLFAATKDAMLPDPESFEGLVNAYLSLRQIPGYLGAWPQPGALDRLPFRLGRGKPVGPGMNRLIGGLYRYTGGGFSILSFQHDVLLASLQQLSVVDAPDSAQVRAHIGNLHGSKVEDWVNSLLYQRAAEGSEAGAKFLDQLSRQLGVERGNVMASAERILGAPLQCTLGGEYQYSAHSGHWVSTSWQGDSLPDDSPADYIAPVLKWFRGADATVTQYDDRLVTDLIIDVQR